MVEYLPDVLYSRKSTWKHSAKGTAMVAHGIRVMLGDDATLILAPLNTNHGTGGIRVIVPVDDVPELIHALQYAIAGPLGRMAIEASKLTTVGDDKHD